MAIAPKNKRRLYLQAKTDPALFLVGLQLQLDEMKNLVHGGVDNLVLENPSFGRAIMNKIISEVARITKGTDGHTPKRGIDYYTQADVQYLVQAVYSRIRVPLDGLDGLRGASVKGDTGVQGKPGKDAESLKPLKAGVDYPTGDQIKGIIYTEIGALFAMKFKRGKDKGSIVTKAEVDTLVGRIQEKFDFKSRAAEIARALEAIRLTREKLDYYALKNLPDILTEGKIESKVRGMLRGGGDSVRVEDISSQTNGDRTAFTVPSHRIALMVVGTDFPIIYRPTTDFTTSQTTLTLDTAGGGFDAPSPGATLVFLYVR